MENDISPKYLMNLINRVNLALFAEFDNARSIRYYISKWHRQDDFNWENFSMIFDNNGDIDVFETLHTMKGTTVLQIAVDLGLETPDFIPSVATFKNEIVSDFKTASSTFDKAFKNIEQHPDVAIGLANSALESIIKEILSDDRITTKSKGGNTLYDLTCDLLKEFQLYPNSDIPIEIRTIGSNLLAVNQSIEKLRSTKTTFHGKVPSDILIDDSLYAYFVINSVTTVGSFLKSFYTKKFPKLKYQNSEAIDDLPF